MNQWGVHNLVLNITEDGPVRAETRMSHKLIKKCIKVVDNKTIYNSYAQHGMKGIKIQNHAELLTVKAAGTYSYHSSLKG
jgi:hypothetical protein